MALPALAPDAAPSPSLNRPSDRIVAPPQPRTSSTRAMYVPSAGAAKVTRASLAKPGPPSSLR